MIPWANSHAARRGAPDDWSGADKLEHGVISALLWGWLLAAGATFGVALTVFAVFALGIEAVEWWRFARWEARGRPSPWPYLCDLPSYRDLAWDGAGAALSHLVLLAL